MYEQRESEKRIIRNSNDRRKGTDQSDVCTDDTVRSQKPENVCKGARRGQSDDAPHRDPHESVFKGCRNDLESFRIRLKETHLPDELQPKAGAFLVQTVHTFDTTEKNQMYRQELLGLEAKVKEIAEQIEGLLKGMRELGA